MANTVVSDKLDVKNSQKSIYIIVNNDTGNITIDQETIQRIITNNEQPSKISIVRIGSNCSGDEIGCFQCLNNQKEIVQEEILSSETVSDWNGEGPEENDPFLSLSPGQLEKLDAALQSEQAKEILGETYSGILPNDADILSDKLNVGLNSSEKAQSEIFNDKDDFLVTSNHALLDHCYSAGGKAKLLMTEKENYDNKLKKCTSPIIRACKQSEKKDKKNNESFQILHNSLESHDAPCETSFIDVSSSKLDLRTNKLRKRTETDLDSLVPGNSFETSLHNQHMNKEKNILHESGDLDTNPPPTKRGRKPKKKSLPDFYFSDEYIPKDERIADDDPNKLWCLCRKPHNNRFMICCDKCEDWFHGNCVGVSRYIGQKLEETGKEWNCPNCRKNDRIHSDARSTWNQGRRKNMNIPHNKIDDGKVSNISTLQNDASLSEEEDKDLSKEICIQPDCHAPIQEASVYCGDKCIENHVQEAMLALGLQNQKSKTNSMEGNLPSVVVFERKTGRVLTGVSAPSWETLETWIKEHPTYEVMKPSTPPSSKFYGSLSAHKKIDKHGKPKKVSSTDSSDIIFDFPKLTPVRHAAKLTSEFPKKILKTSNKTPTLTPEKKVSDSKEHTLQESNNKNFKDKSDDESKELKVDAEHLKASVERQRESNKNIGKEDESKNKISCKSSATMSNQDSIRSNVRKTMKDILWSRCKECKSSLPVTEESIKKIVRSIENELFQLFGEVNCRYKSRYRSLIFNLKDVKNPGLFRKVVMNAITPGKLVRMSPEELASRELAEWRERETKHQLEMIRRMELDKQERKHVFIAKTSNEERIIEADDTGTLLNEDENVGANDTSLLSDTTGQHLSHLFDLNCQVCTKKMSISEFENKYDRKLSVIVDKEKDSKFSEDQLVSEKKRLALLKEEEAKLEAKLGQVMKEIRLYNGDSNSITTPDQEDSSPFWEGTIHMPDVSKFAIDALKMSGPCNSIKDQLPSCLEVVGRINPDNVWEYISKMKKAGNKSIILIRFCPHSEEDKNPYMSLFSHLSSKHRFGVIGPCSDQIKDFYIYPLASQSIVPAILLPLENSEFEDIRPDLLLGLVIKHKRKKSESPPFKNASTEKYASFTLPTHSYSPPQFLDNEHSPYTLNEMDNALSDAPYSPGEQEVNEENNTEQLLLELNRKIEEQKREIESISSVFKDHKTKLLSESWDQNHSDKGGERKEILLSRDPRKVKQILSNTNSQPCVQPFSSASHNSKQVSQWSEHVGSLEYNQESNILSKNENWSNKKTWDNLSDYWKTGNAANKKSDWRWKNLLYSTSTSTGSYNHLDNFS